MRTPGAAATTSTNRKDSHRRARAFLARLAIAGVVATVCSIAATLATSAYARRQVERIPTFGEVELAPNALDPEPNEPAAPANFLVVGSDTRAAFDTASDIASFGSPDTQSGQRADTMLVVHVDPASGSLLVLSLPRDLLVDIPGRGEAMLNSAFNDGIGALVETIRANFGLEIHHALQVDFAGFAQIVDAIGTIPIHAPAPVRDLWTGLSIPLGGCAHLDGAQALAYVRSRAHFEAWVATGPGTGYWHGDGGSDLNRIARQQYFLRTLAHTVLTAIRADPLVAGHIVDASVAHVTRDEDLDLADIRSLVAAFAETDAASIPMVTLPAVPAEDPNRLRTDRERAEPILAQMRSFGVDDRDESTSNPTPRVAGRDGETAKRRTGAVDPTGPDTPAPTGPAPRPEASLDIPAYGCPGE